MEEVAEGADGNSSPLAERTGQKCNKFLKCWPKVGPPANQHIPNLVDS